MKGIYILAISIVISGAMMSGAFIYVNKDGSDRTGPNNEEERGSEERESAREIDAREIDIEGWPTKGDLDAPVVIIEYSDYVCPFCKKLKDEALSEIEDNYVENGRVLMVFKDFPVVGGDRAAEAAHCAAEQGDYWSYHDILFERQASDRGSWADPEVHRGYAEELGLDSDELVSCFEERRFRQKVVDSTREAQSFGVRGTPYLLVNSRAVSGAQSYQVFEQIIEQELGS